MVSPVGIRLESHFFIGYTNGKSCHSGKFYNLLTKQTWVEGSL